MADNQEPLRFEAAEDQSFTQAQVYWLLRNSVYPPCAKSPDQIRKRHNIETDLGKEGNAKSALAGKTNRTFGLSGVQRFRGPDMDSITTVRDHDEKTCEKLQALGRLTT